MSALDAGDARDLLTLHAASGAPMHPGLHEQCLDALNVVTVPFYDTGLGREAGYENDAELIAAGAHVRAEIEGLLTAEALATLDGADRCATARLLGAEAKPAFLPFGDEILAGSQWGAIERRARLGSLRGLTVHTDERIPDDVIGIVGARGPEFAFRVAPPILPGLPGGEPIA